MIKNRKVTKNNIIVVVIVINPVLNTRWSLGLHLLSDSICAE